MVEHTDLPDDVESLKQLVVTMRQALAHRDLHIEHLKLLLAKLQRARYGRSPAVSGEESGWVLWDWRVWSAL